MKNDEQPQMERPKPAPAIPLILSISQRSQTPKKPHIAFWLMVVLLVAVTMFIYHQNYLALSPGLINNGHLEDSRGNYYMSDWFETCVFAIFLAFFFIFLSLIQRKSKKIMKESIDVTKERIQVDRELLAEQKQTNGLLTQILEKLDKKI